VILCAVIAANLPFVNERRLVVGPARRPGALAGRPLERAGGCGPTIGLGRTPEARIGQAQGRESCAALASRFFTLAVPGCVRRYRRRRA
jgi:hypothetical protein